jgi:probable 2-oxoglutarate dehydrogenase E1 component DHKTD1
MCDLTAGTQFQPVLADPSINTPAGVERVVLLTGKLYYDLVKARSALESVSEKVALVRIEELSPFPFHNLKEVLEKYEGAKELAWVQEEPKNQGAWTFVEGRIRSVVERLKDEGKVQGLGELKYVGRKEDAVPAPGVARIYGAQQRMVINSVFEGL